MAFDLLKKVLGIPQAIKDQLDVEKAGSFANKFWSGAGGDALVKAKKVNDKVNIPYKLSAPYLKYVGEAGNVASTAVPAAVQALINRKNEKDYSTSFAKEFAKRYTPKFYSQQEFDTKLGTRKDIVKTGADATLKAASLATATLNPAVAVQSVALNTAPQAVKNIIKGDNITNQLGEKAMYGLETAAILQLTNSVTDKVLGAVSQHLTKVAPKLAKNLAGVATNTAVQAPFKYSKTALTSMARNKAFIMGSRRVIERSLLEVPVETLAFGLKDSIDKGELKREQIVKNIVDGIPSNVIGNLAFAGLNIGGQGAVTYTKTFREELGRSIKNTLRRLQTDQQGFIKPGAEVGGKKGESFDKLSKEKTGKTYDQLLADQKEKSDLPDYMEILKKPNKTDTDMLLMDALRDKWSDDPRFNQHRAGLIQEGGEVKTVEAPQEIPEVKAKTAQQVVDEVRGDKDRFVWEDAGTRNQYEANTPYRKTLDAITSKLKSGETLSAEDAKALEDSRVWELNQVLKDKPAYLDEGLGADFLKKFAADNKLVYSDQTGSIVVAKDDKALQAVLDAQKNTKDGGRSLGLALGYEDIKGTKVSKRGFLETVEESAKSSPELKAKAFEVEPQTYEVVSSKEAFKNATEEVAKNYDTVKREILESKDFNEQISTKGLALIQKAQQEGRYEDAIEVVQHMDSQARNAGRYIQALSLWSNLSPEGFLKLAQKEIRVANERLGFLDKVVYEGSGKKLGRGEVELDAELTKQLTDLGTKINATTDANEKTELTRQALEAIASRIPPSGSELIDSYRYQNMLSSPKSQMRNIYSNMFQAFVTRPATLANEAIIDIVGSTLKGEERTKYFSDVPLYYRNLFNAAPNGAEAFMAVMKGEVDLQKPDLQDIRSKNMPASLTMVTRFMEGMDRFGQEMIGAGEFAVAKNRGATDEQAAEQAIKRAEYLLFRQQGDPNNKTGQGDVLSAIDRVTAFIKQGRNKVPGMKWFVPFIQTPMNVFKQWVEYTPGVGMATLKGNDAKSEQIAKQMVGGMAYLFGATLAAQGDVTWAAPTDPKEKELFYASGRKPFSVKVGETWVPFSYAGPLALSFGLPAAIKYYNEQSRTAMTDSQMEKIGKILGSSLELLSGQSFLSGLDQWVRFFSGDIDYSTAKNAAFTAGQAIPAAGLLRYITTLIDPVYRRPKGFSQQLMKDLPFVSKTVPAYTEPTGEESRRLPINALLPYDVGRASNEWDQPLDLRRQQLQQNAVNNKQTKEIEQLLNESRKGGVTMQFDDKQTQALAMYYGLDKIAAMPAESSSQVLEKEKKAYQKAKTLFDKALEDGIDEETQKVLVESMGVTYDDAKYYDVASKETTVKVAYIKDEFGNLPYDDFVQSLALSRYEVAGSMLASNGVIDDLYEEGLLTANTRKALKNIVWDKDTESLGKKPSASGSGSSKSKKVQIPTFPNIGSRSQPSMARSATAATELSKIGLGSSVTPQLNAVSYLEDLQLPDGRPISLPQLPSTTTRRKVSLDEARALVASLRGGGGSLEKVPSTLSQGGRRR